MPIQTGILPAGSTLTVDYSIGETATISYQDGDIGVVDNGQTKTTDRTIGPFANDVAYSIDYTGWPKVFTTASGGAITTVSLPLPDPANFPVGTVIVVDGHEFRSTSNGWESDYYAGSGVPFVLPSSGNVTSTSGDVSVTTAFHSIIGPSFTWYQQGVLFALSPAGWYFTVWTSTTVGKVYANTYLSGEPSVPASPTPLTTVIGSYTQVINQYINGPAFAVPGSVMGKNGVLEWHRHVSGFSSATQKTTAAFFGLEVAHSGQFTTNSYVALAGSLVNRGTPHRQVCANSAYGDSGLAGSLSKLVTDTLDVQFSITAVKLAAATDYVIIEATTAFAKRGV